MKKLITALSFASLFITCYTLSANTTNFEKIDSISSFQDGDELSTTAAPSFTQELKNRFIEGGPGFMGIVLICLILGLAISIERIIFLNLATTNTKKIDKRC